MSRGRRLGGWLSGLLPPAAWAAGLVSALELGRTVAVGATELGGVGPAAAFGFAIAGLLGLPLLVLGGAALVGADGVRRGWRWGRRGAPVEGARAVAWTLYGLLGAVAVVLATQQATMQFVKLFRRPVYQGLGAGLVAAAVGAALVALAGPAVGVLDRGVAALGRRLPAWADPRGLRGASLWGGLVLLLGAYGAPVVMKSLHTVDLRPARFALLWVVLLGAARWWAARRPPRVVGWAVAGAVAVASVGGFLWSARALNHSQARGVALERDTLLAGKVAARLSRLGDGDGDGMSRWFGGADCDDTDPKVRPGVYDAPGDGQDQNCNGADLVLADDPLAPPPRPPAGARKDWHVVLVTVDALRDDTARAHMPNLQALAKDSVDFTQAYSHGAATYWSLPALLQSTVPSRLHMGRDQTPVASELLLTEVLRDAGWHTGLFANVTIFFVRGLRQGTHTANYDTSHYTVHGAKPGSAHLTDGLLKHVDAFVGHRLRPARTKLFVWGHYYDPHDPYFDVPEFPAADGSDQARYEAIVRYTDRELGRLVEGLKAKGVWDKTLFIVTADHGDEFLDHGHRFHGATLYEEMVHVPLLMRVPGVGGKRIDTPIGHMEVAPTVCELLGVPVPRAFRGRSRAGEILGGPAAQAQPVFFEVFPDSNYAGHQVGLRLGDLKLIHRLHTHTYELYDLAADPKERANVVDTHPQAAALKAELARYVDHHLYWLAKGRSGAKLPPGAPPKAKRKPRAKKRRAKRPRKPKRRAPPKSQAPAKLKAAPSAPPPAPRSGPPASAPAGAGG